MNHPDSLPLPPVLSATPTHANISPTALARVACALEIWQGEGAQLVSLPWVAPEEVMGPIPPSDCRSQAAATPYGQLLSSAAQAFFSLARQGRLEGEGPFVGWAPCFRSEAQFGDSHHHGFLHAESFAWVKPGPRPIQVYGMAHRALSTMRLLAGVGTPLHLNPKEEGLIDIELAGMKVGSCGIGRLPGPGAPADYLYATVLAEPRFSHALSLARPQ